MDDSVTHVSEQLVAASGQPLSVKPRWLPGLLIGTAYWGAFSIVKSTTDNNYVVFMTNFVGPLVTWLLFMIAWLGFSRRSWGERLSGLGTFIGTAAGAGFAADSTMKFGLVLYCLPTVLLFWGVWGWAVRNQSSLGHRRVTLAATMVLTASYYCLLRLDGVDGSMRSQLSWRWAPTAEQRFLANVKTAAAPKMEKDETAQLTVQVGDWPGFRGPQRDSVVRGASIETDWSKHAPQVAWKKAIGPGWSSFAVVNDRLFTQEQRGDDECVTCYDALTGAELWSQRHASRFFDPVSGAGPRGTPQFADGKIFAQGANGHLFCLDAVTGKEIWKANIATDSQAKTPMWGFSGSPLVIDGVVITVPGGESDAGIVAYRVTDGSVAWKAGKGISGYTSAQRVELLGHTQVIGLTNEGAWSLDAQSGQTLWQHQWPSNEEIRIAQPLVVDASKVVIPTGQANGARLIEVKLDADKWSVAELWTSKEFHPYFNDYVLHAGHAFGFDGAIFCCVDLSTGKRRWKKGRYGSGQVLLLDGGLLLVISETGEVVLLEANPQAHTELAKITVLEGKTWNHPAVVRGRLYVRNSEQLACIKLAVK